MFLSYITLAVALSLSVIAAYYSIMGLAAIFAAAVIPIIVMGSILELGKVVVTLWLHEYWRQCRLLMKMYLVPAVVVLMLITSMGIFGFLSKAHSDQSMVSGDVQAKIALYDEKIKIERENIDVNRKALKQMDEAVDQVMGRSSDEKGADKAVTIRRAQQKERGRLLADIAESQKKITSLNEERAPIAAEVRKVEAEVGPIKYIAAFIYGDNPDANLLEKAVTWVIIIIVIVFDPLAIMMLLAATESLKWNREKRYEPDDGPLTDEQVEQLKESVKAFGLPAGETVVKSTLFPEPEKSLLEQHPYLAKGFSHFKNLEPMVYKPESTSTTNNPEPTPVDDNIEDDEHPDVKAAMVKWKTANPGQTLKEQRYKLLRGEITELPWMYLVELPEPNSDFGTEFPESAGKGDTFVRVDRLPNQVYKFNGTIWIEVDKTTNDSYTYNEAYLDHLITKIDSGEYDIDLLSANEQEQIAQRLQKKAI